MKLIIAKSLVQSILGVAGSTAGAFAIYEREISEELGAKPSSESKTPKIPHFNDIVNFDNKLFSVSRTDSEVVIDIKDDFIVDTVELGSKLFRKCMPLALQQIKVAKDLVVDFQAFDTKWSEKPKAVEEEVPSA